MTPFCPYCDGPLLVLGQLGRLIHLRCRDCGLLLSAETDDEAREAVRAIYDASETQTEFTTDLEE